jgi:hypothetical protein
VTAFTGGPSRKLLVAVALARGLTEPSSPDGLIDKTAYRLCLLEAMRSAIGRRDLFAAPSLRYADPRLGLLSGPVWEAARPARCRTVGLSNGTPAEESRLPGSAGVTIDGGELVLTALERIDEPQRHQPVRRIVDECQQRAPRTAILKPGALRAIDLHQFAQAIAGAGAAGAARADDDEGRSTARPRSSIAARSRCPRARPCRALSFSAASAGPKSG